MSYDNTNTGILSRNDRKTKDAHPDFSGAINVDGVDYWLSGWVKEGRQGSKMAGKKYFSLSVQPKDQQQRQDRQAPQHPPRGDDLDDLPF